MTRNSSANTDCSSTRRRVLLETMKGAVPLIAPSMLKCDFGNLHREVAQLETAGARVLHLDVMDGHFVNNLTYGPVVIRSLRQLTRLPFDAHLMISEPGRYLNEYLDAGCDMVTVHIEAVPEPHTVLRQIRSRDALAGIALNPQTPVSAVEPFLEECDLVLVMSVEPGFGGQSFLPGALEKLQDLKQRLGSHQLLSIDGGVGPSTITPAAEAGAELFVVGSALFDSSDYRRSMEDLVDRAGSGLGSYKLEK